jgi:hypothetical protein
VAAPRLRGCRADRAALIHPVFTEISRQYPAELSAGLAEGGEVRTDAPGAQVWRRELSWIGRLAGAGWSAYPAVRRRRRVPTGQHLRMIGRLADQLVVLDHDRVIATGAATALTSRVGGDRLEL